MQTSFKGITFFVGEYKSSTISANSNFDIATFASTDKLTSIILLSPKSFWEILTSWPFISKYPLQFISEFTPTTSSSFDKYKSSSKATTSLES